MTRNEARELVYVLRDYIEAIIAGTPDRAKKAEDLATAFMFAFGEDED